MNARASGMRDLVNLHVMPDVPVRSRALPFADRVEIRFGNAYPVALLIDRAAIDLFVDAILSGQAALEAATQPPEET